MHYTFQVIGDLVHEIPAIVNEKISDSVHYTFQVIGDLVHDFMNFNAIKIIKKFIKKLRQIQF